MDNIANNFFNDFPHPRQIDEMFRASTHLPKWLTIQRVSPALHEEAIALITEKANALLAAR